MEETQRTLNIFGLDGLGYKTSFWLHELPFDSRANLRILFVQPWEVNWDKFPGKHDVYHIHYLVGVDLNRDNNFP